MRTTDGGRSWYAVCSKRLAGHAYTTTGLDVTTNYDVFFDPFDAQRMFIAYTDIGLFRSENGGSPVDARVLYATGLGRGVFKSVDSGKSWTLKKDGLPGSEPLAWRLARDKNGVLYLVVACRSENGTFGNAGDGAFYRSTDGHRHWERIALPEGMNGPERHRHRP